MTEFYETIMRNLIFDTYTRMCEAPLWYDLPGSGGIPTKFYELYSSETDRSISMKFRIDIKSDVKSVQFQFGKNILTTDRVLNNWKFKARVCWSYSMWTRPLALSLSPHHCMKSLRQNFYTMVFFLAITIPKYHLEFEKQFS